jgi:hypothetical protein
VRPVSSAELLNAWERGVPQSPPQRALTLLAIASDTGPETLALLPIGERDARLLTLREWTFGPELHGVVACPSCGESAEVAFETAAVRIPPPTDAGETLSISLAGWLVQFRLPNTMDLAALDIGQRLEEARRDLLQRCIQLAECDGGTADAEALPGEVMDAVAERMAAADPQADVRLVCRCPACGAGWKTMLDIGAFFWTEIEAWALRTLRDIHVLASAYGWREADILAMSAARRHAYLKMVDG